MRVDVLQLRGRWPDRQSDYAIAMTVERARERGHDVSHPPDIFGSAALCRARNQSLRRVRPDSDFVLFVDDDMCPTEGALTRLMDHNKPVVSALCTTRTFPPQIAAKHYDLASDRFSNLEFFDDNTLCRGPWGVGMAFVLIQTPVLFQVLEYVLTARDWLDINRKQLDRLHVRSEVRERERTALEAKRRCLWEKERIAPVFQFPLHDEHQTEVGEDNHFSRLLHYMGIEVWLDSGCYVGHIGQFPYSPYQLGLTHPSQVRLKESV